MYELEADKWTLITDDTAAMGGPCLLFDHHLAIDVEQQTLYVFGGRQITRYRHFVVVNCYNNDANYSFAKISPIQHDIAMARVYSVHMINAD